MKFGRHAFAPLVLATLALLAVGLSVGPGDLSLGRTWHALWSHDDPVARTLVWQLRLPRAVVVLAIGASLAGAGAVTQGLLRNPLAEPGVLGISAGAASGAAFGFMLHLDAIGSWPIPLAAIAGAAVVLAILLAIGRGTDDIVTLLLSGVAIAALCSALTTLMLALGTQQFDLGIKVVRWLMGSFEGRGWNHALVAVPAMLVGLLGCVWVHRELDALQLGRETAASLGVRVRYLQWIALCSVAMLVGIATALAGMIGFVGLVVPHIARRWVGTAHARLIAAAALIGAALLIGVDTLGRAWPNLVLPPGAITSLLGAPFFLWLLHNTRGAGGRGAPTRSPGDGSWER
jgi:iron complex transport system permease protein